MLALGCIQPTTTHEPPFTNRVALQWRPPNGIEYVLHYSHRPGEEPSDLKGEMIRDGAVGPRIRNGEDAVFLAFLGELEACAMLRLESETCHSTISSVQRCTDAEPVDFVYVSSFALFFHTPRLEADSPAASFTGQAIDGMRRFFVNGDPAGSLDVRLLESGEWPLPPDP